MRVRDPRAICSPLRFHLQHASPLPLSSPLEALSFFASRMSEQIQKVCRLGRTKELVGGHCTYVEGAMSSMNDTGSGNWSGTTAVTTTVFLLSSLAPSSMAGHLPWRHLPWPFFTPFYSHRIAACCGSKHRWPQVEGGKGVRQKAWQRRGRGAEIGAMAEGKGNSDRHRQWRGAETSAAGPLYRQLKCWGRRHPRAKNFCCFSFFPLFPQIG